MAVRNRLDFWQTLSGACLALFICIHLVLEGSVVLSPVITKGVALLLEVTYAAQVAAPLLISHAFGGTAKWLTCYTSDGTGHAVLFTLDNRMLLSMTSSTTTEGFSAAWACCLRQCLPQADPAPGPACHHAAHSDHGIRARHPAGIPALEAAGL
ncbi:MAG: hypothetical protein K6F46_02530 [Desulfovibrio sp.]|nr:hypothetical protein [Desulfovibrio sp.]